MGEATCDYKVIKRLLPRTAYWDDTGSQKKLGIFLNTKTIGLDAATDTIIELAMEPYGKRQVH